MNNSRLSFIDRINLLALHALGIRVYYSLFSIDTDGKCSQLFVERRITVYSLLDRKFIYDRECDMHDRAEEISFPAVDILLEQYTVSSQALQNGVYYLSFDSLEEIFESIKT